MKKLVEMHSSWLAIDSVKGCTNACKYCLFQSYDGNIHKPKVIGTPKEAVQALKDFKYYDEKLPLCLLPGTDAFLNESNINYLLELIDELENNNIKNDLILVTKCFIPKNVIERLTKLKENGHTIVVYLSYSGLGKDMEPNVNHQHIRENFKNLSEAGIDVIHYFRPFLPANSNPEKLKEILDFVNQYTNVSTIMGLKLIRTFIEKIKIWSEMEAVDKEELLRADAVWTGDAWDYFYDDYSHEQRVYQTNTCALNYKLGRPSPQYFDSDECREFNHCTEEQYKLCSECVKKQKKEVIERELLTRAEKIGLLQDGFSYHFDEHNGIVLENTKANISDLAYLSNTLGVKVYLDSSEPFATVYNSALNGAKPLVLRRGK